MLYVHMSECHAASGRIEQKKGKRIHVEDKRTFLVSLPMEAEVALDWFNFFFLLLVRTCSFSFVPFSRLRWR